MSLKFQCAVAISFSLMETSTQNKQTLPVSLCKVLGIRNTDNNTCYLSILSSLRHCTKFITAMSFNKISGGKQSYS